MMLRLTIALMFGLAVLWPASAAAQNDLERARSLYNAGQFEEAIAAATTAKSKAALAPSATMIAARARLERFRQSDDPKDLAEARTELASLDPQTLAPQEAIEWQIGLGSALVLENQLGPAAEMFTSILPEARVRLSGAEFEKLLEWWAGTAARVAEGLSGSARTERYAKLRDAVREEMNRDPLSRPATYWTVVAARGAGDPEGSWNAAVAGWIRAGSQSVSTTLRADLERFVVQTLIPERAQARTGQRLDAEATLAEITSMTEDWRTLVSRWH